MTVPAPQEVPAGVSGPHGPGRGGGEAPARGHGDPEQQRAVSAGGMDAGAAPGLEGPPQQEQVRARAGVTGSGSRGPRRGCPFHTAVSKAPSRRAPGCAPAGDGGANDLLEDAVACPRSSPLREAEFLSVSLGLSSPSPLPRLLFPSLRPPPLLPLPLPHLCLFSDEPYPARPCPLPALHTPRSLAEAPTAR